MANIFSSGDGMCPSSRKTVVKNYTRYELRELYETTKVEDLNRILNQSYDDSFRVSLDLNCVNQGRNGHYWKIMSARLA